MWIAVLGAVVAVAATGYAALHWFGGRITVDDTATVLGVSRLGLTCKLCYLLRIPVPAVNRQRFAFFAASTTSAVPMPTVVPMHLEAMRHHLKHLADGSQLSRVLVVAFSGGATNKIGLPRHEFRRVLGRAGSAAATCDTLFVLDSSGMSFYRHGLGELRAVLAEVLAKYALKVVLFARLRVCLS
jgi:hypothetical protein